MGLHSKPRSFWRFPVFMEEYSSLDTSLLIIQYSPWDPSSNLSPCECWLLSGGVCLWVVNVWASKCLNLSRICPPWFLWLGGYEWLINVSARTGRDESERKGRVNLWTYHLLSRPARHSGSSCQQSCLLLINFIASWDVSKHVRR